MKQLWFAEKDKVELRDVPVPPVGQGQIKVKIAYAALCATDAHMVSMGVMGAKPPRPLGHEASGVVTELGAGSEKSGFKPGDKVCLFPETNCGLCPPCKEGRHQYCENALGTGAFAEYVVTDASALFKIPEDADLRKYALTEPANCTVRAMDLAQIRHGETVAVSGVGGIGSIMLNMILLSGAAQITVIEPVDAKRENALGMGAQYAINPRTENVAARAMEITEGRGFDYVFEVSGSPNAIGPAFDILAKCGNLVCFAVFPPSYSLSLNLHDLYMKEGRIQTVFTSPDLMPRTIRLLPRLQLDRVIGTVLPLHDGVAAFELFVKSIYPKILLDCKEGCP
ncbi:MAG: alcohol dehydrogenase catalytic domain-containing protein [Clostridiales Family XIII bacterium]|jgi:(R,R)-butanediol dehydrogenase/meso-butanediol dehydrogenase/diacetyl reductase|nr:alcohol dehydrogenase catalytic domain-containing protein [Clostridiales Family XIII bacterium]